MRKWIGYWVPLLCVLILAAGTLAAWLGAFDDSAPTESPATTAPASTASIPTMTPSLITAGATLTAVIVGGLGTYLIQSGFHRRDRRERDFQRVRDAYANWAGAILRETDALRNLLAFRESIPDLSSDQPEAVKMHMLESIKEMSVAVLDATHKEQVAFCQVMLTDLDKARLKEAHEIRMPIKSSVTDAQADLTKTINNFTELESAFADRLSKFLGKTATSLKTA